MKAFIFALAVLAGCASTQTPRSQTGAAQASNACGAQTSCQSDAAASHDRASYQLGAQQERDRASLMMILTTSRPQ